MTHPTDSAASRPPSEGVGPPIDPVETYVTDLLGARREQYLTAFSRFGEPQDGAVDTFSVVSRLVAMIDELRASVSGGSETPSAVSVPAHAEPPKPDAFALCHDGRVLWSTPDRIAPERERAHFEGMGFRGYTVENLYLAARVSGDSDETARDDRQRAVAEFVRETFGPEHMDEEERGMRFFEEATELAQAIGLTANALHKSVNVVYARQAGQPAQELGGVGLTLLALAAACDLSAEDTERAEVARLCSRTPEEWRQRQRAKADLGISRSGSEGATHG